jgi:hypothetical protein
MTVLTKKILTFYISLNAQWLHLYPFILIQSCPFGEDWVYWYSESRGICRAKRFLTAEDLGWFALIERVLRANQAAGPCAQSIFAQEDWASLIPNLASIVPRSIVFSSTMFAVLTLSLWPLGWGSIFWHVKKTELKKIIPLPLETEAWPLLGQRSTSCNLQCTVIKVRSEIAAQSSGKICGWNDPIALMLLIFFGLHACPLFCHTTSTR